MYRLIKPLPYEWSFVRDDSAINPYFDLGDKNRIRVRFIELLDSNGKSYGIWPGFQVEKDLLSHICRAIQASSADWEYLSPEQTWGMDFEIKQPDTD